MVVIGLGTGRTGTKSLAALLNAQHDSRCFHEMNPHPVRFGGTPHPILNTINEFQAMLEGGDTSALTANLGNRHTAAIYDKLRAMQSIRLIGDVALYYLPYVELIAGHNPSVRFICTRRDIDETVRSFTEKTRAAGGPSRYVADFVHALIVRGPFTPSKNHWMEHDGSKWRKDNVWDKCFPKFKADNRQDAIRQYCEFYYSEAERLAAKLGARFCFVEMHDLGRRDQQAEVLDFVGIAPAHQVYLDVHENRSLRRAPAPLGIVTRS